MAPRDVLKLCQEKQVQFVDLRFMDFPGLWQHTTVPITELTLDAFAHGIRIRRQQHSRLAGDQ